jgi:hypothetical protein
VDVEVEYYIPNEDNRRRRSVYKLIVLGGSTTPKYSNVPCGEVVHGVLRLQACLRRCWYDVSEAKKRHNFLLMGDDADEAARKGEDRGKSPPNGIKNTTPKGTRLSSGRGEKLT